ncbi:MAG TPA: 50S ribosomal protein L25 [Verrucomicrobiae bacterium]|nr:50S ribosomal protein L25 [Verrucomicrobiae bacterium]
MTAQSATPTITAKRREELGRKVKGLRKEGLLPAVMYGHNKKSISLAFDQKEFTKLYHEAGTSTLIALKVDNDPAVKVLIHDIEVDPLRRTIQHADLYIVNLKEKLRTEITLTLVGTSDAVEILGGTLIAVKDFVEVECLPEDLVSEIEVDISILKTFEDTLTVADLKAPAGIVILDEPEQTVVSVTEPRSEEEMAALDEVDAGEVTTEFGTEEGVKEAEPEDGDKKAE